jgi:preprotein translocase subunit SecA
VEEGGLQIFRAFRGLPKASATIKYLSEPGVKVKMQRAENYYLADQQKKMGVVDQELYFHIDEKNNQVDLTEKGLHFITRTGEDPNFFVLPDLSIQLAEIEKQDVSADEKLKLKEQILNDYALKADRYTLFSNC